MLYPSAISDTIKTIFLLRRPFTKSEYLQNIITNDINKVSEINSIFAALLSPQGKYLFDFFVIKDSEGYLIDCDGKSVKELVINLSKYKIRSKVEIKDLSSNYVVGVINFDNFK